MPGDDLVTLLEIAMPFGHFDAITLILYVLFNVIFLIWWRRTFVRKGLLTLQLYLFGQIIWLPVCFMLPFAASDLNALTLGDYAFEAQPYVAQAFHLGVLGAALFPVGFMLARWTRIPLPGLGLVFRSLNGTWITSTGATIGALVSVIFLGLFVALGFEPFNARTSALLQRQYLPIYNFFAVFVQFMTLCILAQLYVSRSRAAIWYLLVVAFGGVFTGARGAFLFFAFQYFILYIIVTRYRKVLPVVAGVVLFAVLAIYMGGWRFGEFGATEISRLPFLLFYGNNFSDLRDFAWILSRWDGELLGGKTLLAGFLTGLPVMQEFRDTYSWGKWSIETAFGSPDAAHPGLRGIFYAEWYFNFGVAGLCLSAITFGFIVGRLSDFIERGIATGSRRVAMVAAIAAFVYWMIISNFLGSAAFFTFHVLVAVVTFGLLVSIAVRGPRARHAGMRPSLG